MKTLEMTGKTVNEALENALKSLNLTEDKVEYEVLDEGSKGFLNLIGTKPAKILVKVKRDYKEEVRLFLRNILNSMKVQAEIRIREENDIIHINLTGPKMGIIIGYRGETLDALQYLTSLVVNKDHNLPYKKVVLDTENYRKKREETLIRVAEKTAYKVKKIRRPYKLEPMNPYERRIIHSALQDNEYVYTFSEGEEPHRRVVIDIKK
ncbi:MULTISPECIES: RNA-binding cell elongation regulator Jag/EloR [unclassified Clostridium]|jgi:SpoIIIJ-associated protein|uniref:RNA-binding cell elongation regulator Jag/EloR n=1 Tax=unclassified Clostridium TaxID=2614128 RepID=UPI0025C5F5D5|nr:RNA-binding cell elongation regulator Jag/EloR [Clostridium sp.]MCI6693598.1 protein jag [Clostridium sp.]MDY2630463.1 RNA-binding cell elongation regulator Jag/EloR [Clostridium sp.]MDY4251927.1 RNA-binding cell elongation regulator Jag/EloR [Clostridium sp.]MDY6228022.1 RNA-binding cell elongation regulator Jag/EloR [Clostridium sp.]